MDGLAGSAATLISTGRFRLAKLALKVAKESQALSTGILPCLLILAVFTIVQMLLLMQSIIVPLLFSFFLTFVADPIVNLLTHYPNEKCCLRFCLTRKKSRILHQKQELDEKLCEHHETPSTTRSRSPPAQRRGLSYPDTYQALSDSKGNEDDVVVTLNTAGNRDRLLSSSGDFEADLLPFPCGCCLRSCRIPRCIAVILAILVLVGFVVGIGWVVAASITSLNANWESAYAPGFSDLVAWINEVAKSLGYTLEDTSSFLMAQLELIATSVLAGFVGFVETLVLVIIFLCYLLASPVRPKEGVWLEIDQQIRKYVHLKTAISLLVGILDGVILMILGVDLAWIFAGFTFIANFIPNIGSTIATLLPLPLAILDNRIGFTEKLLVVVAPFVLHNIVGNYIEPKVFGKHMDLHPIVVLAALGFWSILWGVSGMILSVPLVAVLRIVLLQIHHPYAEITVQVLEGRVFGKYDHVKDVVSEEVESDLFAECSQETSRNRTRSGEEDTTSPEGAHSDHLTAPSRHHHHHARRGSATGSLAAPGVADMSSGMGGAPTDKPPTG
jgi:predicted PurR-regulated permease PerM